MDINKMLAPLKKKKKKIGSSGMKAKFTWFDYLNYIGLGVFAFLTLYPMIYVLAGSFNDGLDYIRGGIYFWPRKFTFVNYSVIFKDPQLWNGYFITIARTVIGTISALFFTSMVAYAMSRKEFKLRKFYYWIFIVTLFFSGGLIPYFLVIDVLGLYDNFLVYIIPGLFSVFNMLVFTSFFRTIPEEIRESALMDGASEFVIYSRIVLPLSKPVLSTIGLWVAVGHWNAFFDTMIFTISDKLQTLQYYLMTIVKQSSMPADGIPLPPEVLQHITPETITLAAIMVSVIPILIVYPLIFKYLTKGVIIGSLKG